MLISLTDKTNITKVDHLDQLTFIRQSLHIPIFLECKVAFPDYKKKVYCLIAETWTIFLAIRIIMGLYKAKVYAFKKPCCHIFCSKSWLCNLTVEHHLYFRSASSASSWSEILTHKVPSVQSDWVPIAKMSCISTCSWTSSLLQWHQ